jgi:hypothetical protein
MIPEKITTIEQRAFLRGFQKFEIRSDGDLEVLVKRFPAHNQFKFPLWQLNPSFTRLKFVQVPSLIGLVIFGLASFGMIVGMILSKDRTNVEALGLPLLAFGALTAACFWKFRTLSVNAVVFYFRNGNGRLHLWFEKPDAKTFHAFCETLTKKSEEAWQNRLTDPGQQSLAGEIAALKKLVDSGALSEADFQRAKDKLIGSPDERKIGFK